MSNIYRAWCWNDGAAIYHHGVKGMKWGVRRYQNKDGTLTAIGKVRYTAAARARKTASTKDDVDSILKTMSEKERDFLQLDNLEYDVGYLSVEAGEHVVNRILIKEGSTPIAFFDLLDNGKGLDAVVGTRNGTKYRGKGYASKAVEQGMNWYEKNKARIGNKAITWDAKKDNIGSRKLAEKHGFVLDKKYTESHDEWARYSR